MRNIQLYEREYMKDYGFEKVMVYARQKYLESFIRNIRPKRVLEVGCGLDLLLPRLHGEHFERWVIVEPSTAFVSNARKQLSSFPFVEVIQGLIEEVAKEVPDQDKFDMCIISGLLHEVEEPRLILRSIAALLLANGILHVNVPNAKSMHRQLALKMGIIGSLYDMSERNRKLQQYRVFDMDSLVGLVEECGYEVKEKGGYFVKPFSHSQMEKVMSTLEEDGATDKIIDALWEFGVEHPDIASEIYVNAIPKKGEPCHE